MLLLSFISTKTSVNATMLCISSEGTQIQKICIARTLAFQPQEKDLSKSKIILSAWSTTKMKAFLLKIARF